MKTIKRLITHSLCILLSTGLLSCSEKSSDPTCGIWLLGYTNDNNWTRQGIYCDSLQMLSPTEVIVWNSGKQTKVYAEIFYPQYKPCR